MNRPTWNAADPLLDTEELAKFFNKSRGTLQNWRCKRFGPPYVKCGASVRYRLHDVLEWVQKNLVEAEQRAI